MAEMTAEMDQIQVPDGGVASFMMSDEDIANLEREEDQQLAEEVYGGGGISQFTDMAAQMASLGRFGDDVIVHAQTGELVIPKKILEDNPEIKEAVFQQLMAQGVEDPEQYVVGSGSASINPETGLAEYFFKRIRRAVSKVAKSVKKVASKVVKVVKKVAPIVLPIAMTMMFPALGPIYGAALGSGIGTLIQGGSFKDALKSAAISGLTGAAFQGFTGPGTFSENIGAALEAPGARFAQVGGQLKSGFSGQGFNLGQKFAGGTLTGQTTAGSSTSPSTSTSGASEYSLAGQQPVTAEGVFEQDISRAAPRSSGAPDLRGPQGMNFGEAASGAAPKPTSFTDTVKGYYETGKDFLFPSGPSPDQYGSAYNDAYSSTLATTGNEAAAKAAGDKAMEALTPNIIQKYGPLAATAVGATYLGGGFDTPEDEPVDVLDRDSQGNVITGSTLLAANRDKYMIPGLNPAPITYGAPKTAYQSYLDQYKPNNAPIIEKSTTLGPGRNTNLMNNQIGDYQRFPSARPNVGSPFSRTGTVEVFREKGGEIFPRRTGGIMPDEGIPGKDSVRAMLMPGEFVMTTDAVKGMGNGNLQKGIQDMYGVMANLERKGRMA